MRQSRWGQGSGPPEKQTPPLKNHKSIGFPSNTGPNPTKNHKAARPGKMLGHHRPRWWADDGPLLVVFESSLPLI